MTSTSTAALGTKRAARSTKRGLLLVNLGTPRSTATADVRRYLREFLMDPRVIDIGFIPRWLLVNTIIAPFRAPKSAEAYRAVWDPERGSPLLRHGEDLVAAVRTELGDQFAGVELAMRYQEPSVARALAALQNSGADDIVVLPLFPQYSQAAWLSAVEKVNLEAAELPAMPSITVIPPFFDHPAYLEACAAQARPVLERLQPERVVISFHGVPERHVRRSDLGASPHCLASDGCCDTIVEANRSCYRAQCFATARGIARALGLPPVDDTGSSSTPSYEVAFQSRLGRTPWIQPFFDERVVALAKQGVRKVAVLSPSFVADCLETLEEIGIRAADDFKAHGGEDLQLVPSLNSTPVWVDAVASIVRERLP